MNTGFLADLALARRQLGEFAALQSEFLQHTKWNRRIGLFALLVLVPLSGLIPNGIGIGIVLFLFTGYLATVPTLQLNHFEALRAPSRQALCVARLTQVIPWMLCFGLALALALLHYVPLVDKPWLSAALLSLAVVAPSFALALSAPLFALLKGRGGLAFVLFILSVGAFSSVAGLLSRLLVDTPAMLAMPVVLAGLTIGLFALQVWVVGKMEPNRQMMLARPGPSTSNDVPKVKRRVTPGLVGPAPLLHGHGLAVAALYWTLARLRYHLKSVLFYFAMTVLWFPSMIASDPAQQQIFNWGTGWLLFLSLLLPPILTLDQPQRLYLLGIDYRTQLIHRIRLFWATPATLLAAVVVGSLALFTADWQMPLAIGLTVLGFAAFREGCFAWPGLEVQGPKWAIQWSIAVLTLLVTAVVLSIADALGLTALGLSVAGRFLILAGVSGVWGAYGMIAKLWRLDDVTLRRAMSKGKA